MYRKFDNLQKRAIDASALVSVSGAAGHVGDGLVQLGAGKGLLKRHRLLMKTAVLRHRKLSFRASC